MKYYETEHMCFTNNPNFILSKWRLKRKHLQAKCVIGATEICGMEICLKVGELVFAESDVRGGK